MRRILYFLLLLCLSSGFVTATPIDTTLAKIVARNFCLKNSAFSALPDKSGITYTLAYKRTENNTDLYYIYNLSNNSGWIIVSADDAIIPVLAYSPEGNYSGSDQPPAFVDWMNSYKESILYVKQHNLQADISVSNEWNQLVSNSVSQGLVLAAVAPLLTTTWNQGCYYNTSCPADASGPCSHVYTGCVATAMAQIMKYWNYPETGAGSHSYTHSTYGTLSANFGTTTYNWSLMPNNVSSANSSVATLMYHCGVSVEMDYSPSGSAASTNYVPYALINYFKYQNTASYVYKSSYTSSGWINMLKAELNASRPVQYRGSGPDGGHSFVCDGYDNSDNFHFNWGWSGNYNGYFAIGSLNPGSYDFNSSNGAVINIKPPCPADQTISGTTPLCAGSTATWTSTTSGGTWTSSVPAVALVGSSTGVVNGVAAGTSLITYSITVSGCTKTAIKTVMVTAPVAQTITGTSPLCTGSTATWTSTTSGGIWTSSNSSVATAGASTGIITGVTAGTSSILYSVTVNGCTNTATKTITVSAPVSQVISGTTPLCVASIATWTSTTSGGTWTSSNTGVATAGTSTGVVTGISAGSSVITYSVTTGGCSNTATKSVTVSTPVPQTVSGITPLCAGSAAIWTSTSSGGTWTSSNTSVATAAASTGLITAVAAGTSLISYAVNIGGCLNSASKEITINDIPYANAGPDVTYAGTPVLIGNSGNGPGNISWLPENGLNDATISKPLASPSATTVYTLTVNNNGCIATDEIVVNIGSIGHLLYGKTCYAGKVNAGNPVPNPPVYYPAVYAIDNVIVLLKSYPSGIELARDTSDTSGNYCFTSLPEGQYLLTHYKYAPDTMLIGNGTDVIDVTLLKYYIGIDTLEDPSRCFSSLYKQAANIDNMYDINAMDIARLKAKVGAPYNPARNFPFGNWVTLDTLVTLSGADVNADLKTICYGDYNGSGNCYRDSAQTWSATKSTSKDIIAVSDDLIAIGDPFYFEVPLRISAKMNDFSALGLELKYPDDKYKLVNVSMTGTYDKISSTKINPSFEEIIKDNNDLLVTDESGTIRVVYATTSYFDVNAKDELIRLGFQPLSAMNPGEIDFTLSGTGVVGNQYGEVNEDAYLIMPKIFIQNNAIEPGFDFEAYPNPFKGEAMLSYNIPGDGNVRITVYNALGEQVRLFMDEPQTGGRHKLNVNTAEMPSGMYTFRIVFTGNEFTRILVVKMAH